MRLSYTELIEINDLSEPPDEPDDLMEARRNLKKNHRHSIHNVAQGVNGQYASLIHARLHKIGGDQLECRILALSIADKKGITGK